MFGFSRKPPFDADTLSSIWVMACRDESPVLTSFSVSYRLGGTSPKEVIELVKSRGELFRVGLTRAQSRNWKNRYKEAQSAPKEQPKPPAEGEQAQPKPQKYLLPDWLQVFDDEAPAEAQDRVREWLGDKAIGSSQQALERFADDRFVVDDVVFRSQFRLDRDLEAEASDLATVNWGLEHIERLRRGRAEVRQNVIALTTGIGGVAFGSFVALTAPIINTAYQGNPAENARLTIDHQTRLDKYAALSKAVPDAGRAARRGDGDALSGALGEISTAATSLGLLLDGDTRKTVQEQEARAADACAQAAVPTAQACVDAVQEMQRLIDGQLADVVIR
jgi:hypothetical protein